MSKEVNTRCGHRILLSEAICGKCESALRAKLAEVEKELAQYKESFEKSVAEAMPIKVLIEAARNLRQSWVPHDAQTAEERKLIQALSGLD